MVQLQEWFAREFSFTLPVWMFPNIVARLRGTPARLEDLVRFVPRERCVQRHGEQWSIQEHAGHLLDLSELDSTRLYEFTAGAKVLTAADRENRKTYAANHNAALIESILPVFRAERMAFVARLDELDEAFVERTALHPRLQLEMRVLDFAFFIAEHDDHHLARISELIRLHGETIAV
ncbi:MAG: DinB family protein [Acidobacteriota bacterium]|nr:DinB family protein [Acidobacteriota bacterium]